MVRQTETGSYLLTRREERTACIDRAALKLISWNIYRNNRPEAVERSLQRLLEEHSPDMLLIQEAPVYEAHAFADLALFEGYDSFYAPAHEIQVVPGPYDFRSTGQLTLSRYSFEETGVHALPVLPSRVRQAASGIETVTRNAIYTRFALCPDRTLGLYNVHLENRALPSGRLKQVRHLLQEIRRCGDRVVIVGGDFNTFLTSAFESSLRLFQREGFENVFRFSKPRFLPRLDYFMVKGAVATEGVQLRGVGSDHEPIMVVVHL